MKIIGAGAGLILGSLIGSFYAAVAFAILGWYVGTVLLEHQKSTAGIPDGNTDTGNGLAEKNIEQRMVLLERRIAALEEIVAQKDARTSGQQGAEEDSPSPSVVTIEPPSSPAAQQSPVFVTSTPIAENTLGDTDSHPDVPQTKPLLSTPQRNEPPAPSIPLRDRFPKPIADLIFGGNTLVKLGVLILFLGLAFLLRYTAERVTVSIEMRYAGVVLVGGVLLAIGWRLRLRRPDYAVVIQGAGIGVFYLVALAAMKLHGVLPVTVGFGVLFGVAALCAVLAILQNAPVMAIIAALEGFAAPVLASTGENNPIGLFSYLLVLDAGILLIAWFQAWRVLNLVGVVCTFTLAVGWAQKHYTHDQLFTVQPFLLVFFLLFIAISFLFARRTLFEAVDDAHLSLSRRALNTLNRVGRVDSAMVFGLPMAAFGLEYLMVKQWAMGPALCALGFSLFYLIAGQVVRSTQSRGLSLLAEAYSVVGVIFATLALPLAFEGKWTGAAWAVEAAGMYWLGIRQQRLYARAFSFAVFAGGVYKLLQATQIDGAPGHALLHGSLIGPLLVAVGAFAMWGMHRRGKLDSGNGTEALAGVSLPWLGLSALTLLLWQIFLPMWAAVATSVLAFATFVFAYRFALQPLVYPSYGFQALAIASFIANLHRGSGDQLLANGWDGVLASLLIAASVLMSVGYSMRQEIQLQSGQGGAPRWSISSITGVVTGVGLLHLSMLFQISLQQAALLWPLSASVVLWVALRIGHAPLAFQAGILHGVSAVLYWTHQSHSFEVEAFAGLSFWSGMVLGFTALWIGDQLRGASRTKTPWVAHPWVLWMPVIWGLFWSHQVLLSEAARALQRISMQGWIASVQMTIVVTVSTLSVLAAKKRAWEQLARSSVAYLPTLVLVTLMGLRGWGDTTTAYIPSEGIGWLIWPIAMAWHLRLLRWQEKWGIKRGMAKLHVAGFWFFLVIASRESQWLLAKVGDEWSSWALLGWILVPSVALWAMQRQKLLHRWPLCLHQHLYTKTAAVPVAIYLFIWAWISNAGTGESSPLPYLPLLNPLEFGQWLVIGALYAWWNLVGSSFNQTKMNSLSQPVFGLTAFALMTGMVLRSCHHYADVPWEMSALYASKITQAALSITWAMAGVSLMVAGNFKALRSIWLAGAALLGIVVLKLFFVELADKDGLLRIVSFLSVGCLLLAVGYFAPVPPTKKQRL
jgi:uncharacterized membrane protein